MGTDYYVRMVVGVPLSTLAKTETKNVDVQHTVNGKPVYTVEGTPLTFTRSILVFHWLAYKDRPQDSPMTFRKAGDFEHHIESLGLTLCRWSNCYICEDDIVGVPLYKDDEMTWNGRIGAYAKGITNKELKAAFDRANKIFAEIGVRASKIKLHAVTEINV